LKGQFAPSALTFNDPWTVKGHSKCIKSNLSRRNFLASSSDSVDKSVVSRATTDLE